MIRRLSDGLLRWLQRPINRYFSGRHPIGWTARAIGLAEGVVRRMNSNDKWTLSVHAPAWMAAVHMPPLAPLPPAKRIFMLTAYRGQFSLDLPLAALLAWRGHDVTIGYFPKLGSPLKAPENDHSSALPYLDAAMSRVNVASGGRVRTVNLAPFVECANAFDERIIDRQSFADAVMELGRETIDPDDPADAAVLARYRALGQRTQSSARGYLGQRRDAFDLVLVANGASFESAHICHVARQLGLPFNTYEKFSFRRVRLMGHDTHFLSFADLHRLWERRAELGYTEPSFKRAAADSAMRLIDERRNAGRTNWAWAYQSAPGQDVDETLAAAGLAKGEPFALVCPNVPFDAGYFDFTTVFPSMRAWLVKAVATLLETEAIRVVVRAHPGEVLHSGGTESAMSILESAGLASHPRLLLIPGGKKVNTYGLMERCKFGTVFSSTTGLEMAMLGKLVVIGADVYYGRCGFTLDVSDSAAYVDALRRLTADSARELINERSEDAQLFHFMLHHAVQWPFPYDKPGDISALPPQRLVASTQIKRYLPTLDAMAATLAEFEARMPEWLSASTCQRFLRSATLDRPRIIVRAP